MKDRDGNEYRVYGTRLESPARQLKKASRRTGRQWRKFYKAARHYAKWKQLPLADWWGEIAQ